MAVWSSATRIGSPRPPPPLTSSPLAAAKAAAARGAACRASRCERGRQDGDGAGKPGKAARRSERPVRCRRRPSQRKCARSRCRWPAGGRLRQNGDEAMAHACHERRGRCSGAPPPPPPSWWRGPSGSRHRRSVARAEDPARGQLGRSSAHAKAACGFAQPVRWRLRR